MIISISGFIGSGKDTVADYLVDHYGFKRESFASTLKDAVSVTFGWDREMLEGRTSESRAWRETADAWWTARLGRTITPRLVLQQWGTEVIRGGFHDDIWIASLERKLLQESSNIVITDCRFPNELTALINAGAKLVRVCRGPEPIWWDNAVKTNAAGRDGEWAVFDSGEHMEVAYPDVHASEYSWAGTEFDVVIDNNGTLTELYEQVTNLVQDLQAPSQHHAPQSR